MTERDKLWNIAEISCHTLFHGTRCSGVNGTYRSMERPTTSSAPPTERELIQLVCGTLDSTLDGGWSVEADRPSDRADALLRLRAPDGKSATLVVEAKSVLDARDVPAVKNQMRLDDDPVPDGGLVVARYLSPRARETLTEACMSYIDATGNVRVTVREPSVFIVMQGADSDPWRSSDRPTNSLRGRPAARVVRTLVDLRPPWKVRDLAKAAGASLGSTSRTVDFLAREALVERDGSGAIVGCDWPALLERWAADYDLVKRRRVVRLLAPRGVESIEDDLRTWKGQYAISGSMAAARWAPVAETRLALIYSADVESLVTRLGLREPPSRPNVILLEPDDDYVFERTIERDQLWLAAPSQAAVDLLAGPGRNPEEGTALIDWMKANEREWRGR
jgi:hypothetical protein